MTIQLQDAIIRGCWQLSAGHLIQGPSGDPLAPVLDAIGHGFRRFDCADIYTGVEELLGQARIRAQAEGRPIHVHTKFVPDRASLASIDFRGTQAIIDRSLKRLKAQQLDLVQFHWWDCSVPRHLEVLDYLFSLQAAGKIKAIGLTNFDSTQLKEIIDEGFEIASIQVQSSLVDRRSERELLPLCRAHGIRVYAYGSLLGGFLSEQWLDQPEPADVANRSLVKYKLIIDDWGGWARFQEMLHSVRRIAVSHDATIAQVAVSAMLGMGRADALIVGLSQSRHASQNAELARLLDLSQAELDTLGAWPCPLEGDIYHLERHTARHAGIMKYDLNQQAVTTAAALRTGAL